ncbi:hypothetical protein KGQ72_00135 [Patescibacteria group bacterium]|nr:hypothetical protein [Patescibacteria group bacterium]
MASRFATLLRVQGEIVFVIDEETVKSGENINHYDADLLHFFKKAKEQSVKIYSLSVLLTREESDCLPEGESRLIRIQTTSKEVYLKLGSFGIEFQEALAAFALSEEVGNGQFILSFPEGRFAYHVVLLSPDNGELVVTLSPAH